MKYALISEEQIKQIQDAIYAPLNQDKKTVLKARAIIKSLVPTDPMAFADSARLEGFRLTGVRATDYDNCSYDTPVYALTTK